MSNLLKYQILRIVGGEQRISSAELSDRIVQSLHVASANINPAKNDLRRAGLLNFGGGGQGSQQNELTCLGRQALDRINELLAGD